MKYVCINNLNRINALFITLIAITFLLMSVYDKGEDKIYVPKEDYEWAYYLIDSDNPLPTDFEIELAKIQGDFEMDVRCADYAQAMLKAAEEDGIYLRVVSAYRSLEKQAENFDNYVAKLIAQGYSRQAAYQRTAAEIARPGESEHNAGLAVDILTLSWWQTHDDITADFENTEEFTWLWDNAWRYGFILRYPKNSETITGFTYEPWHYRFVGTYYSEMIYRSGLCLEDYMKENE